MRVDTPNVADTRNVPSDWQDFTIYELVLLQQRLAGHIGTVSRAIELKLADRTKPSRKAVQHG